MRLEELQKLVAKGESEGLEFKKTTGQRSEAAKTVCAMLNGLGGFVLFGVSDKGEIAGQQVTAKTLEDITQELRKIEPPAFPEIETVAIGNDKAVILIRISGKMGTYCYDGRPYLRHGPTTQIMPRSEYEKRVLDKFHAHRRWENELAPDWVTVKDLDEEEIQSTLQNAIKLGRMKNPSQTDSESILRGLGLFDDGRLINAAVALYGKSERLFSNYPQLSIRLARFRGSDRLTGFMDNRDYWGNAFDLLRRGELFLLDHVSISGRVVPGKMIREDYPLYPPLATREALANSICHRDYTTPGGAVAIALYDDRLEIINPGVLHFDITPEKLARPHESKPWNPIIASVFYRAGVIEKWGMGTLNIIDWCKENGNPKPTWEVRAESVVTTFLPSSFFATGKKPGEEAEEAEKVRPGSRPEWKPESRPESLEDAVLDLLKKGPLSKGELSQALGHKHISGALKKTLISLLKQEKIAYTIPNKPNSRLQKYKLN
ncbi:MAG: putative DNA binding domain-containing protein [Verrucomicrobia bacterium]|nr:putative DNA binding domain-containing protein [Verrucomicrobiota bacterium]